MHMVHRYDMRMGMGHMNSSVEHGNPLYLVNLLHGAGDVLRACCNLGCQCRWQVLEPDMMFFRDHEGMTFADWMQVKKGEDVGILIYLVCRKLARGDLAEKTVFQATLQEFCTFLAQ